MGNIDDTATLSDIAKTGVSVYTKSLLVYDFFVLGYSNRFIWKCPTSLILDLYNQHITSNHMDIGVATGYYLDRCRYPSDHPNITLVDLNPACLRYASRRINRYNPQTYLANALEPLPIKSTQFDSIAMTYLLHCIPGSLKAKSIIFQHVKPLLSSQGVVFGATILNLEVKHSFLAPYFIRSYNQNGIFGNSHDSLSDLDIILADNFSHHSIYTVGSVAFFVARR